ncbi:MAG: 30S ribosomal protein S12 methylthiotransferase RimO [Chlamydiae bacterium]|nr:30S ribosomal protein S12 methylthiotransferase RimO [Chlamydiota bacterium]
MGNTLSFVSLGCSRNLVDTEVMLALLLKNGYEVASNPDKADFHIINTCGFLEAARQEAIDTVARTLKVMKPSAKIIVTGCMVSIQKNKLADLFPEIHYFLGSADIDKILTAVRSFEKGEIVSTAKSFLQNGEVPRLTSTPKHYAYLKIAEGCRKQCAFCIIPKIKGPLSSKSLEQIDKEFQALIHQGVKEVILIAQDLGDFGKDRRENQALHALLRHLLKKEGQFWIRLLYLYPDEIDEDLIALIQSDSRVLPYLDMPIQHINDRLLKLMFRKTSRQDILSTIQKLREQIPHIVIRTSLMVGFPSETECEFEELVDFVQSAKLDNVGVFSYSREELSHSHTYEGHLDEETKTRRYNRLMQAQQKIARKKLKSFVGKKLIVLVDGVHPEVDHLFTGRFYGQCPEIDGSILINGGFEHVKVGDFVEVQISDSLDYDLIGQALRPLSLEQKNQNTPDITQKSGKRRPLQIL